MVLQAEGGRKDRPGKGSALAGGEVSQPTRIKKFTCLARAELLGEQSCRPPSGMQAGDKQVWRGHAVGEPASAGTGAPQGPWAGGGAWCPCSKGFGRVSPGHGCRVSRSVAGAGSAECTHTSTTNPFLQERAGEPPPRAVFLQHSLPRKLDGVFT